MLFVLVVRANDLLLDPGAAPLAISLRAYGALIGRVARDDLLNAGGTPAVQ
jgi:hypothetical protein